MEIYKFYKILMVIICHNVKSLSDLLFNDKIFTENSFKTLDYSKLTKIAAHIF